MEIASAPYLLLLKARELSSTRGTGILVALCVLFWIGAVPCQAQQKGQWVPGQYGLKAGMGEHPLKTQDPAEATGAAPAGTSKGNEEISTAAEAPQLDYAYRNYLKFYGDPNTRQNGPWRQTRLRTSDSAGWGRQTAANPDPNPASPASYTEGLHVNFTPYLWLSGTHGSVGVQGREASIHARFSDVLDYLNLGFMATTEVRLNRVIIPVDFMWIKLTDKKAVTVDQGTSTAKAEFKQTILTPGVGYRLIDGEKLKADGLVGIRYWHLNSSLTLQPSQVGSISSTANWVDVLGGGRIEAILTPKLSIQVFGTAGGGGANSDYGVGGLMGMRVAKKWTLLAGYRYMSVNYRPSSTFVYDIAMSGIVIGATWNIK